MSETLQKSVFQVYRMYNNGDCDLCFEFKTKRKALNYVRHKTEKNPCAEYQIFEKQVY